MGKVEKIRKNIIIVYPSDYSGCGNIRTIMPSVFLNSIFGNGQKENVHIILASHMIFQEDILQRTRTIVFQRTMFTVAPQIIDTYLKLQEKYQFKMVYDIDDYIWIDDGTHGVPSYNFGRKGITNEVSDASKYVMKHMDKVMVSTDYLKGVVESFGISNDKIHVVHNSLPSFMWGTDKKAHITEKIKKPRIVWSASPTHWDNDGKQFGDMSNGWYEWIVKSVKEDKIEYIQMGGLPWFFEEIKDKIEVIDWVSTLKYPNVLKSLKVDFGISPLQPNIFNSSKSPIKYQEYCKIGAVGIGTYFTDNTPSPYDICQVKVSDDVTVESLDELFSKLVEPEQYNSILDAQYEQFDTSSWETESIGFVNMITRIL